MPGLSAHARREDRINSAYDLMALTAGLLANDRERLTWNYPADLRAEIVAMIRARIEMGEELMARYRRQLD